MGSGKLAGFGHHPAQSLIITARVATIVFTVLGQSIDTIHIKFRLIQSIGLVTEVLSHTRIAREHGFDDFFPGVTEFLVLKLHQNDGNATLTLGGNARVGIAATNT